MDAGGNGLPRLIPDFDVRFGSKADTCVAKSDVRFTPESDIKRDIWECPLWARNDPSIVVKKSLIRCGYGTCIPKWRLSVVVSVALGLLFHSFVPVSMCTCLNKPALCVRSALEFR